MRMMDMHKMTNWISDAMEKYKELTQENNSYRWVTDRKETPALGGEYFCPAMTLKKDLGSMRNTWEDCIAAGSSISPQRGLALHLPMALEYHEHISTHMHHFLCFDVYIPSSVRIFWSTLIPVECGSGFDLPLIGANMQTVALFWRCLGMGPLKGWLYLQEWPANRNCLGFTIICFWFSIRNFQLLNECNELKKNVRILMNENRKLLVEQTELQASFEEGKRFCEEASKTIYTADIESLCPVTFE